MSSPSAVILLSAGLDSAYNLFQARKSHTVRLALTFNYGQKAASREVACAHALASDAGVVHQVIDVPWFKKFTGTALLSSKVIPSGSEVRIDDPVQSAKTAKSVWVPNRNGILLNIAAGFAEGLGADFVIPCFNADEAATFPDNTDDFLRALDVSWSFSTATHVRTHCLSTALSKSEIVAESMKIGLPFTKLWPCYQSGAQWCGECESCQRFRRALTANGLDFERLRASHEVEIS